MSNEKQELETLKGLGDEPIEQRFNIPSQRQELTKDEKETLEVAYRMAKDGEAKLEFEKDGDKVVSVTVKGLLAGKVLFYSHDIADIEKFLEIEAVKP